MSLHPNVGFRGFARVSCAFIVPYGWLLAAAMIPGAAHSTAPVPPAPLVPVAAAPPAADARTAPMDFAYRVHGNGPAIGVVFDDGRDVFMQPVDRALVPALRIIDRPFRVQGPYLVVRGLIDRIEVEGTGLAGDRTIIEYRGRRRTGQPDNHVHCTDIAAEERRVTVPFGTGVLQTEPGGLEHLARMVAIARGARRVTIVSQGDRSNSPIARRRAAQVRELLVAAGVEPASIVEQVQTPAASSVHVTALREAVPCEQPAAAASTAVLVGAVEPAVQPAGTAPDPLPVSEPMPPTVTAEAATEAAARPTEPAAPGLRLVFRPDRSVQAALRDYLKAHGMEVEFRAMPVLMVEALAEVGGSDVRDVLRRALSRLGLRGEIQGNRLLVVEPAR